MYQVSDLGRVRSLDRVDSGGNKRKGAIKQFGYVSRKGYATVCLGKNNKQYMRYVHRLVVSAFIAPLKDKEVVNHIDLNCKNNELSNLEIVTQKENMAHASSNSAWNGQAESMVVL